MGAGLSVGGFIGAASPRRQAAVLRRTLDLPRLWRQRGATHGVRLGGPVAEWSGTGLQNLLRRFNSAPDLQDGSRGGFHHRRCPAIGAAHWLIRRGAAVAQRTVNPLVVGSNPTAGAIQPSPSPTIRIRTSAVGPPSAEAEADAESWPDDIGRRWRRRVVDRRWGIVDRRRAIIGRRGVVDPRRRRHVIGGRRRNIDIGRRAPLRLGGPGKARDRQCAGDRQGGSCMRHGANFAP
jgi:hypothetical protein